MKDIKTRERRYFFSRLAHKKDPALFDKHFELLLESWAREIGKQGDRGSKKKRGKRLVTAYEKADRFLGEIKSWGKEAWALVGIDASAILIEAANIAVANMGDFRTHKLLQKYSKDRGRGNAFDGWFAERS